MVDETFENDIRESFPISYFFETQKYIMKFPRKKTSETVVTETKYKQTGFSSFSRPWLLDNVVFLNALDIL